MQHDEVALRVYNILQMSYCLLSIVGCIVAMISILIVWRSSQVLIKIIFFIVATQLIVCIVGFLSVVGIDFAKSHYLCSVQGFVFIFFQKAGLMWIATISLCMALIAKGFTESSLEKFYVYMHLIFWLVPAALSVPFIPFISRIEAFNGELSTWCVVKGKYIIESFFVPLLILFVFNIICILYIITKYPQFLFLFLFIF